MRLALIHPCIGRRADGRYVRIVLDKLCPIDQQLVNGRIEMIVAVR